MTPDDGSPAADEGEEPVSHALARLGELGDKPVQEHLSVYEDIWERLSTALGVEPQGTDPDGTAAPGPGSGG